MAVLTFDGNIGFDSTQYTYDGLFLGGRVSWDDLFIPKPREYLTDPRFPGDVDPRGYMTGHYDESRTFWI